MIELQLYKDKNNHIVKNALKSIIKIVLYAHGFKIANISVICVEDDELRIMKKEYFGQNLYTDIISFNLSDNPLEGELYISCDRIKSNAVEFSQVYHDELKRVIIHGLLHLCGHEDSSKQEKIKMTNLENKFLDKINHVVLISK